MMDYLYAEENQPKTQDFLFNNGFPSREDREYNKEFYGEKEEKEQSVENFRRKTNSVLNPSLPNSFDRDFRKGLMGDEEEERDYNQQVEENKKAKSDYAFAFRGSPFEHLFTEPQNSPAGMPIKKQDPLEAIMEKYAKKETSYPQSSSLGSDFNSNDSPGAKKTSSKSFTDILNESAENNRAYDSLHNTAHNQYPWIRYASTLSPAAAIAIGNRISSSSDKVAKHKDIINDVANRYNVPSEIIGGIIFKEQFTKSLPDTLANIDTSFIRKDVNHSTGLGAIFPKTARDAWKDFNNQKELPKTDEELQYKLTHDRAFNIETIAVVLLYEAKNKGIISDISEASNLTTEQWWKAVAEYNGSGEYARKVYEYLPYITELLD